MSALPTRIEKEAGQRLTPLQIFDITAARETTLSHLLMLYISTGLLFMLLPGTFLGVWNLLAISSHRAADSVSPAWIQAHGHAQIFGWIGTFILGIGFYSIPKLRRLNSFALSAVWSAWALWTGGVTLRWLVSVYQWHWRTLLPLSAILEFAAFLIFFRTVSGHRPQDAGKSKLEHWVFVVIAGSVGLLLTLLVNLGVTLFLGLRGASAETPAEFDQRFLVLQTWGFLVPFVWGFSAKWLPVFLGLRPVRGRVLLLGVGLNSPLLSAVACVLWWMNGRVFLQREEAVAAELPPALTRTADKVRAGAWATLWTGILIAAIVLGSRTLQNFDPALVIYTFAIIFATWGAVWIRKPPTYVY